MSFESSCTLKMTDELQQTRVNAFNSNSCCNKNICTAFSLIKARHLKRYSEISLLKRNFCYFNYAQNDTFYNYKTICLIFLKINDPKIELSCL